MTGVPPRKDLEPEDGAPLKESGSHSCGQTNTCENSSIVLSTRAVNIFVKSNAFSIDKCSDLIDETAGILICFNFIIKLAFCH